MNLTDITDRYGEYEAIKKCTIICCADHGVAAENVSAYPQETTAQMVRNYLVSTGAAANVFANFARSELLVVDVGVDADLISVPGIVNRKIARGTNNIAQGPAMTINQALRSIRIGIRIVETACKAGYNCFLPGEMGIANTTAGAAVAAVLLGVGAEQVTGRGTNISDERFQHKLEIVRQAISVNRLKTKKPRDPIEVLSKVGGFEFGCMAGIILGAYRNDALVILDGFNTSVAALIACFIEPECRHHLIASHVGREKGHQLILDRLGLNPMLELDLALGEAIGSSLVARLLDQFTCIDYDVDEANRQEPEELPRFLEEEFVLADDFDEDFDIEFNVYNGSGLDARFISEEDEAFSIEFKRLGRDNISVTDRTFNFYLSTMPTLDRNAMERSQARLDNLTKPCRSLGMLEEIVVQIAGISGEDRPGSHLKRNILCFTDKVAAADEFDENLENPDWDDENNPLADVSNTAEDFDIPITFAVVGDGEDDPATAFDFGRAAAEDVSFKTPIVGLTILNDVQAYENLGEDLDAALLTEIGALKYEPEEFLRHVPIENQRIVSAIIGALVAAAHNSSLVVVDIGAVDIIARYVEELCPEVRPYILHASRLIVPDFEGLDDELDAEAICIAMEIIHGALLASNEMKTFDETGVSTAVDGIGIFRRFD